MLRTMKIINFDKFSIGTHYTCICIDCGENKMEQDKIVMRRDDSDE